MEKILWHRWDEDPVSLSGSPAVAVGHLPAGGTLRGRLVLGLFLEVLFTGQVCFPWC